MDVFLSSSFIRRIFNANLQALTLRAPEDLDSPSLLFLTLIHAVGITFLTSYLHFSIFIFGPVLAALLVLQFLTRKALLAPLFFAYAILLLRFVFVRVWHWSLNGYYDYLPPEWGRILLDVEAALVAAAIYSLILALNSVLKSLRLTAFVLGVALFGLALGWGGWEYLISRTHGTTGSDPYDYVQMGIDLASNGSFVHRFGLFPMFASLKVPWYPLVHVGYHLPMNVQGDAVTVFPVGGAVAYAVAFRVFGEEGLYWVNPLFSILSALAAGLLAWELTHAKDRGFRIMCAALTCGLIATANQQVVWAGVTMVDAQAELASILAVYFALRTRTDRTLWSVLIAGALLGLAYLVRHTQIVIALSIVTILWIQNSSFAARAKAIFVCGAAALVLGLGDLWYHQTYLGGWLNPESEELALFSVNAVITSANNLYLQAFAGNEFGWLSPFLIVGVVLFARRARPEFVAVALWIAVSLLLHLPYSAVRLRDLVPEFPPVAFLAAFGICSLLAASISNKRFRFAAAVFIFGALELLVLRVWNTVPRAWEAALPNFGYMNQSQRLAFDQLAMLTPKNALIGAVLNDGAIDLYSRRETFRPDAWSSADRREFLSVVSETHPEVYLLEDGPAMDGVLDDLGRDTRLELITELDVPLFGDGPIRHPGALWRIVGK